MPSYEAIADGFINGSMYGPNLRRNIVTTDKELKPVPSWLKAIKEETQAQRNRKVKADKNAAAKIEQDRKDIESAALTADLLAGSGVETL